VWAVSPTRWRASRLIGWARHSTRPSSSRNKLGAGGAIGVDYVLNSPQDGYTILFLGSTLFTVLPLAQKVNYEPLKTLLPVSITGTNGMVLVVDKNAPLLDVA